MSDTDTEDRYQRPDPSSGYTQSGDPASFAGGYAGATPGSSRIASLDTGSAPDPIFDRAAEQLKPAQGQVGWQPYDGEDRVQQDPAETTPFGFRQLTSASPYIPTAMNPALRDRSANDWATPDYITQGMTNYPAGGMPEGQYMPTEADIPGIIHNATMTLGRFGPPSIGMPMVTAGRSWLAGMKNYQQGALQAAQLNERQAKLQFDITQRRLNEMLRKYSNVFATFGPDESGKDYNADRLHEEVTRIAHEYGDSYMLNLVNTKDWGAVDRHLKHLDGTGQDLEKTKLLLERERLRGLKAENDAAERARREWGVESPGTETPAIQAETTRGQLGTAAPGAPETAAPEAAPPTARGGYQMPLASQRVMGAAQQAQMGQKPVLPKDEAIQAAVDNHKGKLDDYMDRVVNDESLSPDQVMSRIRLANPRMANTVQGLLDGTTELTAAASDKPENILAGRIAKRINPDYIRASQKIKTQKEAEDRRAQVGALRTDLAGMERNRSNLRSLVVKNVTDMQVLNQIAERLKARGLESQIPIINSRLRQGLGYVSDDADLARFYAQLQTVRADTGRILTSSQTGAGVVSVHAQKEAEALWDRGLTAQQLRAVSDVLKRDYGNKIHPITAEVNALHGRISQIQGTAPPAEVNDKDIESALSAEEVRVIGGKTYYKRNGEWHDE